MQILVIPQNKKHSSGFTLIEIMVVLLLMSLLSAIVLPRLTNIYDGFMFRSKRDKVLQSIKKLGFQAYNQQQNIILTEKNAAQYLQYQADELSISIVQPIIYHSTGFCLGGQIRLAQKDRQLAYQLPSPYCLPQQAEYD